MIFLLYVCDQNSLFDDCVESSFLSLSGADQEHKTDEMHTALMEASMDGHVDVARLLLDHGAQVQSEYYSRTVFQNGIIV